VLGKVEYVDFRRRLGEFLARRGFGWEVCEIAVKRLWAELREADCR
jgi:hypothetical protein